MSNIREHFEYEEQVLMAAGFPDCEKHAQKHKELQEKAQLYKESYRNGDIDSTAFLSFIVDDVIGEHIAKEDLMFFPYTRIKKRLEMEEIENKEKKRKAMEGR